MMTKFHTSLTGHNDDILYPKGQLHCDITMFETLSQSSVLLCKNSLQVTIVRLSLKMINWKHTCQHTGSIYFSKNILNILY